MFYLSKKNLNALRIGSLCCATGGGLSYRDHGKAFDAALSKKSKILCKEIAEFHATDYLASIYGVGDPSQVKGDFVSVIKTGVKKYTQLTGITPKGIIPGEIGAEGLAFQAASYLNLPVVDSDLVGGRAAPEIQMDVFSVYDLPLTPLLAVSMNGKELFLNGAFGAKEIEGLIRLFFKNNGSNGLLIGYPIQAKQYQQYGMSGTISRAIAIGDCLLKKDLPGVLEHTQGKILGEETIDAVSLSSQDGFLQGWLSLGDMSVLVKNEYILVKKKNKMLCQAPENIMLLDKDLFPIHSTQVQQYAGKKVSVFVIPGQGYWKVQRAKKLWDSAKK